MLVDWQGVQGQVQQVATTQDASASSAIPSTDQNQTAAGAMVSQPPMSQTVVTTTTPGQVLNPLPNPPSQTQPLAQTAVQPTAEQWYQQQQYLQYYQQYPGQDPYQQQYQQYYPYQQSVVPQYQQAYGQPQPQSQPQPQPQSQNQSQPQLQTQTQAPGLSQPLSHVQAPLAPQSQNQMQVHQQQQQLQPVAQPHNQIQSLTHPPAHAQPLPQPQPYPYPQVQPHAVQPQPQQHVHMPPYQQPHSQMQHSQPQIQQPVQKYPVPQPQVQPQLQPHTPVQHISQPQMHPHQPLTPNVQPQVPNTSSHAVTGHHSYPQIQPQQNMQPGVPHHTTMQMHPQIGSQPQAHHPVQMQNQFSQQIPMMRPPHHQQQPALLPSPVQGQTTPPLQHQSVYTHNQQPGQINRPVLQPVQQILPQQPFAQHQMPMPSNLRPQGPAHSVPRHPYPQSQGNATLSNSTQHGHPQNSVGRPLIPTHAGQGQSFAQSANTIPVRPGQPGSGHMLENQNLLFGTNNQVLLSSELQSRASEPIERQGDVKEQQNDSASGKLGKNFKDLDTVSGSANELKSEKVETDMKPIEVGNRQISEDRHSVKTVGPDANALENGDSVNKNLVKGEAAEVQNDSNEHSVIKGNEIQDGIVLKIETTLSESEIDKPRNDDTCTPRPPGTDNPAPAVPQTHVSQGPGIDEYRGMQSGGFAHPSHPPPLTDQFKHQQPMNNYGPAAVQQRSSAMLASQLPHPAIPNQPLSAGHPSTLLSNHAPAHAPHLGQPLNSAEGFQPTMFKQPQGPDIQFGIPGRNFQPQSLGPPGPYNQGHEPPFHAGASNLSRIGGPHFGVPPPGDMRGGMTANLPPHAPESFGLQDERFKSFQVPGQLNIDRREFEDDLKKFPRPPLDAEPASQFGNYSLGPHEAGKRPIGFHDDAIKKSGSALHPGYPGIGPGYGRHHVDGMNPRSPVSEYPEMSSRRLGPHSGGQDDFDGRAASRFGESVGIAFRDGRFPHLPSHLHRDEFEGFGNFRMGEHPRSGDFIGQDEFSGHFRRGEHLGPHNFPRHLHLGDPIGFGAHPGHMRGVEISGSRSFNSFSKGNRPGHPQLGEPGFRSSFSLPGFPNDAGLLTVKF